MTDELKRKIDYVCDSIPQLPRALVIEMARLKDEMGYTDIMDVCDGAYDFVMTLEGTSMEDLIKEVRAMGRKG